MSYACFYLNNDMSTVSKEVQVVWNDQQTKVVFRISCDRLHMHFNIPLNVLYGMESF